MSASTNSRREHERLDELRRYTVLDTPPEVQFDTLVAIAATATGVPIALISLLDEHRQWFKAKIGLTVSETPREQAFCEQTILGTEPLVVEDTTADSRFNRNELVRGKASIRFYAGIPLVTPRGLALGSLCLLDRRPRALTPEQLSILQLLGNQIVQLLELRLATNGFRRQSTLLNQSQRTAHIGGWELDLSTNTTFWTDETYRIHGVTRGDYQPTVESAIRFYTPMSAQIIRRAVAAALSHRTPYDLELQIVRKDGRLRWIRTIGQREDDGDALPRLYGVFQDVTLQRELEQTIVQTAEHERERIGSDLHDSLGQTLTGLAFLAGGLRPKLRSTPELFAEASTIEAVARNAINVVRGIAQGLSPTGADAGGLVSALRALAREIKKLHAVSVAVRVRGKDVPTGAVADNLFRIIQEAITNAIKHGAATRIAVVVDATKQRLRITVTDNGRGIDPHQLAATSGMGLRFMRYRARLIGASIDVAPGPYVGTRVRCELLQRLTGLDERG